MGASASLPSSKGDFRRLALAARAALSSAERRERSDRIRERCELLPGFVDAPLICPYVGFRDEVETEGLIRALLRGGRRTAVPAHLHGTGHPLVFAEISSWSELVPNHFGILQPAHHALRVVPTAEIALFLVPGVAFDPAGRRIGFGLGFYDRALADARPGARRVGLAFECQVFPQLPADDHDVPMDLVVTEQRTLAPPPRGGNP